MDYSRFIRPNVKDVPPSGIRKYFDLLNEMKDAISLGVGEPDFVTPANIIKAGVESLEKGFTHYSSNSGFIELREEISRYLEKFDLHYEASTEVLVTVGGSEGIDVVLRALAGPGDEVIIPEPSFVAYKGCAGFCGAKPVLVDLKAEDQFRLKPEQLEKAITSRTKVVVIPYPCNPTGAILERDDLAKLVEVLKDKDVIVLSDEVYCELTYKGNHTSIASFPGMREKTIVINGFSKAFAMTGWRLGYACAPRELMDTLKKIHQYVLMCSPTTAQYAAIEALRNGEADVAEMVSEYDRRRRVIVDGLNKIGLDCFEPLGAFYVFPSIKRTGLNSEEFCDRLLAEEKVLVVPGNSFGECGEVFIRATYANSLENIKEALSRIGSFVSRYDGGAAK